MKHAFLTCCAAVCSALGAAAVDATSALVWIEKSADRPGAVNFAEVNNSAIPEAKQHTPQARTWQYVRVPLHFEGSVKEGKQYPHFLPEVRVKLTVVVETVDEKGQTRTSGSSDGVPRFVMLQKEMTCVDIPLVKSTRSNAAEAVMNVGMFISPADAYKLSMKDGALAGKVAAVAIECKFKRADSTEYVVCSPKDEKLKHPKTNEDVYAAFVFSHDADLKKMLKPRWWSKDAGNTLGTAPRAISETPFALNFNTLGFPTSRPIVGPAESSADMGGAHASVISSSVEEGGTPASTTETTPTGTDDSSGSDTTGGGSADTEDSGGSTKDGKRAKRTRRTRR